MRSRSHFAVPPLERGDGDPVHEDLIVQVIADGESRRARAADLLALLDFVTRLDADAGEVRVEGLQSEAMVHHHRVAVDCQRSGEDDHARVGGRHRHVLGGGQVVAEVHLRCRPACPGRDRCATRRSWRRPWCFAAAQRHPATAACPAVLVPIASLLLFGLTTLVAIDDQESLEQRLRRRSLREQLGDLRFEQGVANLDGVVVETSGA